jgi:hypothetical protein
MDLDGGGAGRRRHYPAGGHPLVGTTATVSQNRHDGDFARCEVNASAHSAANSERDRTLVISAIHCDTGEGTVFRPAR